MVVGSISEVDHRSYEATGSVWIKASEKDIWMISRPGSLSICIFDSNNNEIIDAIFIQGKTK